MFWTSAILLGLLGSTHCALMCGPIVLAISAKQTNRIKFLSQQLFYNAGRLLTYLLIGAFVGLVGKGLFLIGLQQSMSILTGGLLLLIYFLPLFFKKFRFGYLLINKISGFVQKTISPHIKKSSLSAKFLTGTLNGLLPCGLVYVAAAGAIATGEPRDGMLFMLLFGLGTFPMMFLIAYTSSSFKANLQLRFKKAIPFFVITLSLLFMLRGMNLGIKYLSPEITSSPSNEIEHCD